MFIFIFHDWGFIIVKNYSYTIFTRVGQSGSIYYLSTVPMEISTNRGRYNVSSTNLLSELP